MRLLVTSLILLVVPVATAQEASYPESFGGILKKDDTIGIERNRETGAINVTIYSDEVFRIVSDSRSLPEEKLDEKYPDLASAKQKRLGTYVDTRELPQDERARGKAFPTPTAFIVLLTNVRLCTVVHVGKDYFVVTGGERNEDRTAYATRALSSLGWQDDFPIGISAPLSLIDKK